MRRTNLIEEEILKTDPVSEVILTASRHLAVSAFAGAFDFGVFPHWLIAQPTISPCEFSASVLNPAHAPVPDVLNTGPACLGPSLPFATLRPPTAAEKLVLEKYESVINKTLDQFQSGDWDENVDYSVNEDVAVGTDCRSSAGR
jgi:hypothetical protein